MQKKQKKSPAEYIDQITKLTSENEILKKTLESDYLSSPQLKQKLYFYKMAFFREKQRTTRLSKSIQNTETLRSYLLSLLQDLKQQDQILKIRTFSREISFLSSISNEIRAEFSEQNQLPSFQTIKNILDLEESLAHLSHDLCSSTNSSPPSLSSLQILDSLTKTLEISTRSTIFPQVTLPSATSFNAQAQNSKSKSKGNCGRKSGGTKFGGKTSLKSQQPLPLYRFTSNLQLKSSTLLSSLHSNPQTQPSFTSTHPDPSTSTRNLSLLLTHMSVSSLLSLESYVKEAFVHVEGKIEEKLLRHLNDVLEFMDQGRSFGTNGKDESSLAFGLVEMVKMKEPKLRKGVKGCKGFLKEMEVGVIDWIGACVEEGRKWLR